MLTTEEMKILIKDEMSGNEQSVTGEEADQFLESFREDKKLADENGYTLAIPSEWTEFQEEDE